VTLAAEAIKLSTSRAPWWWVVIAAVLSLGLAVLQALAAAPTTEIPPARAAIGVATFGVPLMMILAAMTVVGEYRTGMIRMTFMATPNRIRVVAAKALITAVISGVFAVAMATVSVVLVRAMLSARVGVQLTFANPQVWHTVGALGLFAVLGAVLGAALGALLRHAPAVIAVLLLMPFAIEPALGSAPRFGRYVGPLLPFANAYAFTGTPGYSLYPPRWSSLMSLAYFAAVVVVLFVLALLTVSRRDP
jgi:hypothetical protein